MTCLRRDQETALETNSTDFPRAHSAVWLVPSVPRKGGAALVPAKAHGPKGSQREMLSMTGRHVAQRERPLLDQWSCSWVCIAQRRTDYWISTLKSPGGASLKSRPGKDGSV